MKTLMTMLLLAGGFELHAQDLLAPGCGAYDQSAQAATFQLARAGGLSCEEVEGLFGATEAITMAIMPASIALAAPGVREGILAQMAVLGLTYANPAVIGISVLGAFGYVTVYFVLKAKAEDCKEARMQETIRREVERRLKVRYSGAIEVSH